jgi:hypothetical protein
MRADKRLDYVIFHLMVDVAEPLVGVSIPSQSQHILTLLTESLPPLV